MYYNFKDSDIKSAMTRYKKLKEQEDILLKRNITISQSTGQGAKGKNISFVFSIS